MGLDHVIEEVMSRFQGQDNNVICDLGEICLGENVKIEQFEKVSKFYKLNSEFLQCSHRFLKQFLKNHTDLHVETAFNLLNVLFKHERFTFLPQLPQLSEDLCV